jgi:hypothetical protein
VASIYFYATRADLLDVLEFVFSKTDIRVFEAYSRVNQAVREFSSVEDLKVQDPAAASFGKLHLRLCSPSVTSGPTFRRYELNAKIGGGYRFSVEDPSIIRVVEGGIRHDIEQEPLDRSEIANWNEAGARQRSLYTGADLDQIDWQELVRLSRRLQRYIRGDLTAANLGAKPILRHAFEEMSQGLKILCGPGLVGASSPEIVVEALRRAGRRVSG